MEESPQGASWRSRWGFGSLWVARMCRWSLRTGWSWSPGACEVGSSELQICLPTKTFLLVISGEKAFDFSPLWRRLKQNCWEALVGCFWSSLVDLGQEESFSKLRNLLKIQWFSLCFCLVRWSALGDNQPALVPAHWPSAAGCKSLCTWQTLLPKHQRSTELTVAWAFLELPFLGLHGSRPDPRSFSYSLPFPRMWMKTRIPPLLCAIESYCPLTSA